MSATERIRAMLDERGVEWRERVWGGKHSVTTFWHARGVRWHYRENRFGEVRLHADGLTPEQAIEATLGRGTCEVVSKLLIEGEYVPSSYYEFEMECGEGFKWDESIPPRCCPSCGRMVVDA